MDAQTQAREDLAAIRRLMEDGQRVVNTAGPHFVAWGLLTSAALAATYVLAGRGETGRITLAWGVAVGLGWLASLALTVVEGRREQVRSATGRILGGVWAGTGVTMMLLGFAAPAGGGVDTAVITGVLAAVMGGGFFATGLLVGRRWMQAAAVAWWAGALAMLLWPGPHGLLVTAGLVLILQTLPGLWLMLRSRRAAVAIA
ncbi:MAG TPA: hypothetical protein VFT45_13745 [Longimicrobium sp.]|nr:hypothetical protein [Longimicrobium sp.]